MVLALFLCFSWLILNLYLNYPQKLNRRESILLFMIVLDLNISVSWIIGYELKKFIIPETVPEYLTFLLNRSLIVPLLPVMFTNWMLFSRNFLVRALLMVGFGLIFVVIEKVSTMFHVLTFKDWGFLSSLMVYYSYLVISLLLLKWYRTAFRKEEHIS